MKYRWLRNILKGVSVTTALFVFQACYGTPQGWDPENVPEEEEAVVNAADEVTSETQGNTVALEGEASDAGQEAASE